MKILILYRVNFSQAENAGVRDKFNAQVRAFEEGHELDKIYLTEDGVMFNDRLLLRKKLSKHSLKTKIFKQHAYYQLLSKELEWQKYDVIYWRFNLLVPSWLKLLKKIKSINPNVKQILEIPSYPYDHEYRSLIQKTILAIDRNNRKKWKEVFDWVVHFGEEKMINEVPCINISNGISLKEKPVIKVNYDSETIELIAVGKWNYWHGLDRLIKGMRAHKSKENKLKFRLTVVGDGPELNQLMALTKSLKLNDSVVFTGAKEGKDLDDLFESKHLGIGVLGLYRKGLEVASPLKHRDYCARGIPFIYSGEDSDFNNELDFTLQLLESDEPIEMALIESFVEKLRSSKQLKDRMRKFAEENLSWQPKVEEILSSLL